MVGRARAVLPLRLPRPTTAGVRAVYQQRQVTLVLAGKRPSLSIWPMVKVRLMAVRRLPPLHGAHGPAPDAVDQILGEIIGQRMDFAPTASHEVNMVRAVQGARTPGHEDHLHNVGNSQVIAPRRHA